jgi:hypothetical protein
MSSEIKYTGSVEGADIDIRNKEIRNLLYEHVCEVTFTKVNGETRTMPCTLKPEVMPQVAVTETHQTRVYKPETLSVWCVDKKEWRSFRVANVTEVRVIGS